ncbi:G-patch-domain-containing protein [Backusella circina FSU 941]|nr:G-patch-domain-containing protein [Backusella circina FSU 941]
MFNQKPAFKFVIKSKIDQQEAATPPPPKQSEDTKREQTITANPVLLDDKKRKRADKDNQNTGKKLHKQLKRWNEKKEELKVEGEIREKQDSDDVSFANYASLSCLLCQRKFKTRADLGKHQDKSELHKNNLNDTTAVEKAMARLKAMKSTVTDEPTIEYRNRAAERRQTHGQPEKPIVSPPSPPRQQPSKELAALPKASMNTPIADDNKGARMLLQMGWRKGEGLGRNGTGILDPVRAESYAQHAGIGASSTREISNESYRNRTLEVARKRFGHD